MREDVFFLRSLPFFTTLGPLAVEYLEKIKIFWSRYLLSTLCFPSLLGDSMILEGANSKVKSDVTAQLYHPLIVKPQASFSASDPHLSSLSLEKEVIAILQGCREDGPTVYRKQPASGPPCRKYPAHGHCLCPPSLPPVPLRMAGFDGSAWDEEEEEPPDHQYYNDFPGKEPPLGGVVDMRLREGAPLGAARSTPPGVQTPSHLGATLVSYLDGGGLGLGWEWPVWASGLILFLSLQPVGQPVGGDPEIRKQMPPPPPCPGVKGAGRGESGMQEAGLE